MQLAWAYRSLPRPSSALEPSHPLGGFLFTCAVNGLCRHHHMLNVKHASLLPQKSLGQLVGCLPNEG